jgi:cell division septal protein FtsQ
MFKNHRSKKIRQDYHRKNLANPFFPRKKKGQGGHFLRWLILFALLLILAGWFFLASSFWRLQAVTVIGLTRISTAEIEQIIWSQADQSRYLIFKQSNIFLFDREAAAQTIASEYNLAGAVVERSWPRALRIQAQERPYAFIFQEGSGFFHASADGYVIKEPTVVDEELNKYPILENKNENSLLDDRDRIVIKEDYLNFFLQLSEQLAGQTEVRADKFIIDQELNMITVKFFDGPAVYFNVKNDAGEQLERLLLVKKEKIKDNFSKMNYIDLRYGDRIFINPDLN